MTEPWTIYNNTMITALLTEEQLAVLKAHDGAIVFFEPERKRWDDALSPAWMNGIIYRAVKPAPTKPSIDWSHVTPQFKWLAQDRTGKGWLSTVQPELRHNYWSLAARSASASELFTSYKPGTCDWTDSLVQRPEGV